MPGKHFRLAHGQAAAADAEETGDDEAAEDDDTDEEDELPVGRVDFADSQPLGRLVSQHVKADKWRALRLAMCGLNTSLDVCIRDWPNEPAPQPTSFGSRTINGFEKISIAPIKDAHQNLNQMATEMVTKMATYYVCIYIMY